MGTINKRIKVIEFIESTNDGGAETLVKDYALMLDKSKFDVKVLVLKDDGNTANGRILKKNNISLIKVLPDWYYRTFKFVTRHIKSYTRNIFIPNRLRKIILQEQPDVLHVHLDLLTYVEQVKDLLQNTKVLYTCHSVPEEHLSGENSNQAVAAKKLFNSLKFQMIALHDKMKHQLNEMFDVDNTVVLHNAIDFRRFQNLKIDIESKRREVGIPQDTFVVGHVGRFCEAKNHQFLVKVFLQLLQKKSKTFLLLVGDGSSKNIRKLRKMLDRNGAGEKYVILDHRTDVNELMKIMDVFVFPSLYEGLGMALVEAEISGLRCIASECVPKEAFLTDKAISLPIDNEDLWVNAILDQNMKGHPNSRIEEFDANKIIKELEEIYANE